MHQIDRTLMGQHAVAALESAPFHCKPESRALGTILQGRYLVSRVSD